MPAQRCPHIATMGKSSLAAILVADIELGHLICNQAWSRLWTMSDYRLNESEMKSLAPGVGRDGGTVRYMGK